MDNLEKRFDDLNGRLCNMSCTMDIVNAAIGNSGLDDPQVKQSLSGCLEHLSSEVENLWGEYLMLATAIFHKANIEEAEG